MWKRVDSSAQHLSHKGVSFSSPALESRGARTLKAFINSGAAHSRCKQVTQNVEDFPCCSSRSASSEYPKSVTGPVLAAALALMLNHSPVQAQQVMYEAPACNPVAEVSDGFLGFGGTSDGSNPFTVYGSVFKKYLIEVLDGEKIVSRKRGFTVDACVTALSVEDEDALGPQFQGLPTGEKVRIAGSLICNRSEGSELKVTCASSCEMSCSSAVSRYVQESSERTGIAVEDKVRERVLKSCVRDCKSECSKPGKAFDFTVPSRR